MSIFVILLIASYVAPQFVIAKNKLYIVLASILIDQTFVIINRLGLWSSTILFKSVKHNSTIHFLVAIYIAIALTTVTGGLFVADKLLLTEFEIANIQTYIILTIILDITNMLIYPKTNDKTEKEHKK